VYAAARMEHAQLALIGDLHSWWRDADTEYFNDSAYELLLFTGDLGSSGPQNGVAVARSLARLARPTLVMMGNNDAAEYSRITAELCYRRGRERLLLDLPSMRSGELAVRACGLSSHRFRVAGLDLTVIAGRPFAMGNSELSFPDALRATYGVKAADDCTKQLMALVGGAETEHLVFLAHNGPSGFGAQPDAPWGRDFHPDAGDWGDADLAAAVTYARSSGRRVLAVVAGHMHWGLKTGGKRRWLVEQDGTLYINAARVPRIVRRQDQLIHHHISLRLTRSHAEALQVRIERPLE
jgi:uncharacterized protein (TIGR04168 family)